MNGTKKAYLLLTTCNGQHVNKSHFVYIFKLVDALAELGLDLEEQFPGSTFVNMSLGETISLVNQCDGGITIRAFIVCYKTK